MSFTLKTVTLFIFTFVVFPSAAFAATLTLDSVEKKYGPGDTFIATVRINNDGDCINAANVVLSYPKDTLRAVDFSRGDSIFSLWAVEPHIDTDLGTVAFAGGIPGGYCGRIPGDAGLTNILGKVVFTVLKARAESATIHFLPSSAVYLNDGAGTLAALTAHDVSIPISSTTQLSQNQWLSLVHEDTTPPQPFEVQVESTSNVFNGKYYIVFSTIDKESGMDHFEMFENKVWKRVTSPYLLQNQSLLGVGDIQVRAIDKAGNVRLGDYSAALTPKRQLSWNDFAPFLILVLLAVLALCVKRFIDRQGSKV